MNNETNNNTGVNPAMNFGPPAPETPAAAPTPVAPTEVQQPVVPPVAPATPVQEAPQPVVPPVAPVQEPVAPTPVAPVTPSPMQPQPAVAEPVAPTMPTGTTEISGSQVNGADALDGTEKKKTPIGMIILTVLVLAGVGVFLFMYLTGKINFGGNGNSEDNTTVVDDNTNTVVLANWMNYLLEQNITEIKLSKVTVSNNDSTEVVLTTEQLREIYANMATYTLNEAYSKPDNYGTIPDEHSELSIAYSKNDSNYTCVLKGNAIWFNDSMNITDAYFLAALESSNPTVDEANKDVEGAHQVFTLNNFDTSVYEAYFATDNEETQVENSQDETN